MFRYSCFHACLFLMHAALVGSAPARAEEPGLPNPHVSLASEAPHTASDGTTLRTLAAALAPALGSSEVRDLVAEALRGGKPTFLADLLARELADGSLLAEKLAGGKLDPLFARLSELPPVGLHMPVDAEGWDATGQMPRVGYVPTTSSDEDTPSIELFDVEGSVARVDPRGELGPVLVLEYRDIEAAVASLATASPLAGPAAKTCSSNERYHSYPLILVAQIRDIHESGANGPEGFAYFSIAGTEKTGDLPASLGGLSGWSTNVWASNFQGPELVEKSRDQWEWTTDGWLEIAWNWYPAPFLQQSSNSPGGLRLKSYTIMEDDEWWNPDDYVGRTKVDHSLCKTDVFDQGLSSGWSREHVTYGDDDVVWMRYKLYCSKSGSGCTATVPCSDGSTMNCTSSGTCGSGSCKSGFDWVECDGRRSYCSDLPDIPDLPF